MIASLIIALHLLGFVPLETAYTSLYIAGGLLILAELAVVSFGLIGINALIALYAAYALQNGKDFIFDVSLGWPALFGIAFLEIIIIASVTFIYLWLRNKKAATGVESMIGEQATIMQWADKNGTVRYEGEIWKAYSDKDMDLAKNSKVTIEKVNKLELKITA